MAHVYVANGTHQHQHFLYRVVESKSLRRLEIPAGRQQRFPEDFSEGQQIDEIIRQLERFGAVPASDVPAVHTPRALVYSVGKPIKSDPIDAARERDEEVRQDVAAQKTEEAGLAQFSTLAQHGAQASLKSSTLEVTQMETVGDRPEKDGVDFEAKVDTKAGKRANSKRRSGK